MHLIRPFSTLPIRKSSCQTVVGPSPPTACFRLYFFSPFFRILYETWIPPNFPFCMLLACTSSWTSLFHTFCPLFFFPVLFKPSLPIFLTNGPPRFPMSVKPYLLVDQHPCAYLSCFFFQISLSRLVIYALSPIPFCLRTTPRRCPLSLAMVVPPRTLKAFQLPLPWSRDLCSSTAGALPPPVRSDKVRLFRFPLCTVLLPF